MRVKLPPLIELPGENRHYGGDELYVDLVPATSWMTNVRTTIAPRDWNRIRTLSNIRKNTACEICKSQPERLDTHERWSYTTFPTNPTLHIQKLERIICLCKPCHWATHLGYAHVSGRAPIAEKHIKTINRWSQDDLDDHVARALATWEDRNAYTWTLDLSILEGAGIVF